MLNTKPEAVSLRDDFTLDAKYRQQEGQIVLSGIQALVRLPLDQHRADQRRGLNTATLVSGYRGSPVGGIDLTIQQNRALYDEHNVVFIPGVNEDLGATAIFGSQLAHRIPKAKYDGVLGMWYGKGPGVDRSGDIFKHANFTGIGKHGGVLAIAGDDPSAKSSTIPSHSEIALYDAFMPVLYPGTVQEILDMGRLGFELSRYSGLWVGFKIVTDVADGFASAQVAPDRVQITLPDFTVDGKPWQPTQNPNLLAPYSLMLEREIHTGRLEAAKAFGRANNINQIPVNPPDAWLGIVAAGKTYYDVRESLAAMGFNDADLHAKGIRLFKPGMLFPLDDEIVRDFARGLDEIVVIEEKRAFIEMFLREILYDAPERPHIVGKRDENGTWLVPPDSDLDADRITRILAGRIQQRVEHPGIAARIAQLTDTTQAGSIPLLSRQPYFCSGCPHNRSTLVPDGSLAGGGIGCHTMVILMDRDIIGLTHMGGEGANWAGIAPFTETKHIFQNMGDGTLAHSGTLAIRQAIAAGVNITYKILYNSAVAMTGGQDADGGIPVPDLTRLLEAEGVRETYVLSDAPEKYETGLRWAKNVTIWHRDRLDEAQQILRETSGVTALIYDQECAANLRRKRKRGQAIDPATRVLINEAVCEGCGDCGEKSNCLSVQPVETEFGRKTQIHQSSCNKDYTCLDGNCPAFVTVIPAETNQASPPPMYEVTQELPDPVQHVPETANVYMMGIGGTGVVTTNQILGTAAVLQGKHIIALDQTGLSQKGGPVVSSLKISDDTLLNAGKIGKAQADAYLVFDALAGTDPKNLSRCHPERTVAVISTSKVPTGAMVRDTGVHYPQEKRLLHMIDARTQSDQNVVVDAIRLAETLFHNHMAANMIVVGAAYQAGVLPIHADAIEKAITYNGVKVTMNINAFRAGRLLVADPDWLKTIETERTATIKPEPEPSPEAMTLIRQVSADGELNRLLSVRVPELIAYQNRACARTYVDFVQRVYEAEQRVCPGSTDLSEAVARYLFKLMAYKDEYEVARLHLKPEFQESLREQFGDAAQMQYLLHPPVLKLFGLKKKLKFGKWFDHVYRLLVRLRGLRGTPLDIFGYDHIRRTERRLIKEYRQMIDEAIQTLTPDSYGRAVKLAQLPDMIRGYDEVKMANVASYRDKVSEILAQN